MGGVMEEERDFGTDHDEQMPGDHNYDFEDHNDHASTEEEARGSRNRDNGSSDGHHYYQHERYDVMPQHQQYQYEPYQNKQWQQNQFHHQQFQHRRELLMRTVNDPIRQPVQGPAMMGSTWLGKLRIFVDHMSGSQFAILAAFATVILGQLITSRQWRTWLRNRCSRMYRHVLSIIVAVRNTFYEIFGSNQDSYPHLAWNYYEDEEDEATVIMDIGSDGDETDLTEPESSSSVTKRETGRSRRRRRKGRGGNARNKGSSGGGGIARAATGLLLGRQSSDTVPPPLLHPGETAEGLQGEASFELSDLSKNSSAKERGHASASKSKIQNGSSNGQSGSKAKKMNVPMKELEPAFLRDCDYPPGWLVYHPVLGVVSKEEADAYDKKRLRCRSVQNGRATSNMTSITAGC